MVTGCTYVELKRKLDDYIDLHNLRHTQEREILLSHIYNLEQPFVAQQLIAAAAEDHISTGSVYNTLALFIEARILHCVNRSSTRAWAEYEVIVGQAIRMQLQCTKCGRVSTFSDTAIANLVKARKYSNFVLHRCSIFVYGECKTCKRPAQKKIKQKTI